MGWKDIEQKLFALEETDYDLNREIFAEVWGWSYPLIGAADHQFERLSRENGRTNFTGDTASAMFLAREAFPGCSFSMEVSGNDKASVRLQAKAEYAPVTELDVKADGPSLPIAILRCVTKGKLGIC